MKLREEREKKCVCEIERGCVRDRDIERERVCEREKERHRERVSVCLCLCEYRLWLEAALVYQRGVDDRGERERKRVCVCVCEREIVRER